MIQTAAWQWINARPTGKNGLLALVCAFQGTLGFADLQLFEVNRCRIPFNQLRWIRTPIIQAGVNLSKQLQ